jgi:hypothetical protein
MEDRCFFLSYYRKAVLVSGRLAERTYTDHDNVLRRDLELSADKVELLATPKQEATREPVSPVTQQTAAA